MARFHILPSKLSGEITIPPSKSHTLRSIVFALMAHGTSHIKNYLPSPDTTAMIHAARLLGAKIDVQKDSLTIRGGPLTAPDDVIDCGNSGQVLRFLGALSALLPSYTVLTGDPSIRHNRPVKPLLDGLQQLGAFAASSRLDGFAPIIIKGPLKGGTAYVPGDDSQPISGLLIAAAFAPGPTQLIVSNPGEKPWIGVTLDWFERLQIPYKNYNFERYEMSGNRSIEGFDYSVPGDFSSAAYPIAAALLTDSEITLHNVDLTDSQGDKKLISVLQQMGAHFVIDPEKKTLAVKKGSRLQGTRIDVNDLIDALPILAVIGSFAEGETELYNGEIARKKESDRIHCITHELKKMGADIEEGPSGLTVRHSHLKGAHLETYHDHRLVLALSAASLGASGESSLVGVECADKSYPTFLKDFRSIGAQMELL